jgi:hypothetical protein
VARSIIRPMSGTLGIGYVTVLPSMKLNISRRCPSSPSARGAA